MAGNAFRNGIVLGVVALSAAAQAAEWESSGSVSVGAYYTDNVCMDNSGEQDRVVGTLRPSVDIRGHGARANFILSAAADYNSAADNGPDCRNSLGGFGNREAVVPSVRGLADLELIEDWLILEGTLLASRNAVDPFVAGGDDNRNRRDNDNISWRYSAGARTERRLGQTGIARLRYNYNEQFNSANAIGDSQENRWDGDIGTDPEVARFSAGITGYYSEIRYDRDRLGSAFENEFSSASIRAAFNVNSSWQVNGRVGREWNEYVTLRSDNDGDFWDVGIRWTPNNRVSVDVGTGRRFFGTSPRLNVTYEHKRSLLSLGYTRTLSIPRDLRTSEFDPNDPFDPGFDFLPGDPLPSDSDPTFIGNTPVLNERWQARYRLQGRRTTMTVAATYSQQERLETLTDGDFLNTNITFSRDLATNLLGNLSFSYNERKGGAGVLSNERRNSDGWRVRLGFTRKLGNHTSLDFGYRFAKQESDYAGNNYEENRIYVTLRYGLW